MFKEVGKEKKTLFIDPYNLGRVPRAKADFVFITHPHYDHLSPDDLKKVITKETLIVSPSGEVDKLGLPNPTQLVEPNKTYMFGDITVKTIPAYNINPDRLKYHPREKNWVGYLFEFNGKKIYVPGDTDFVPEMKELGNSLALAFLPIGNIYTMDVLEAVAAANTIHAKVTVPIHYKQVLNEKSKTAELQFQEGVKSEIAILKEYR